MQNLRQRAERICVACGTPLTFHFLEGDAIEVTTGSLDMPGLAPPTRHFGIEARLPWIDLLMPGRLPESGTAGGKHHARGH